MRRLGAGLPWCLALALAWASDAGFGQGRSSAGTIQPVTPAAVATAADATGKAADQRQQKAAKQGVGKAQPKRQGKRKNEPGQRLNVQAQAKIKLQAKSTRFDRRQPPAQSPVDADGVERCWRQLQAAVQPTRLLRLSEECEREFPASPYAEQIRDVAARARKTLDIQRSIGLSGDFFEDSIGDAAFRDNLAKAVRGDKDAAYLIALSYRLGMSGVAASSRRMEQWLRFSAELGSGLASWELAEFYNYGGLVADAARFEKRAVELGFRPPFRLPTRGY